MSNCFTRRGFVVRSLSIGVAAIAVVFSNLGCAGNGASSTVVLKRVKSARDSLMIFDVVGRLGFGGFGCDDTVEYRIDRHDTASYLMCSFVGRGRYSVGIGTRLFQLMPDSAMELTGPIMKNCKIEDGLKGAIARIREVDYGAGYVCRGSPLEAISFYDGGLGKDPYFTVIFRDSSVIGFYQGW